MNTAPRPVDSASKLCEICRQPHYDDGICDDCLRLAGASPRDTPDDWQDDEDDT